jgi:hypothetical protein
MDHPVIAGFRKEWPSSFAGLSLDKLSGNAFRWSTTQNRRSRGEIPVECFVEGRPTIVLRGPFLDHQDARLKATSEAKRPLDGPARRGRGARSRSANVPLTGRRNEHDPPRHQRGREMRGQKRVPRPGARREANQKLQRKDSNSASQAPIQTKGRKAALRRDRDDHALRLAHYGKPRRRGFVDLKVQRPART